jgi:hypothetical protein
MGANFDSDFIEDPELKLTDAELVAEAEEVFDHAAYMYGHAGYSGTFAEKTGEGATIHRDKEFNDNSEAYKYVQEVLDNDKWGPADVVPIKGKGWFIGGWCSS